MIRALISGNVRFGSGFASAFLVAALFLPGCAPAPVDDLLVDGDECNFDSECQSGYCWQAASEAMTTCKAMHAP